MKKAIIAALLLGVSSLGFAATGAPCTGGAAANATVADASSDFAVTDINFRCSQNVFLNYSDSTTVMGVGAGSAKGKNAFKGNSAGGAVTVNAACPASGCTATQSGAAATQGLADGGGSSG
jgi:hypothetical protein